MKKLFTSICVMVMLTILAQAQTATVAKKTTKTTTTAVKATPPAKTATVKAAPVKTTAAVKTSSTTKVKADGTPDMRYKENKTVKVTTGPKKADGTPDLRYKANKTTTSTKTKTTKAPATN